MSKTTLIFTVGEVVEVQDVDKGTLVCYGDVVSIGDAVSVSVPRGFYPPNESDREIVEFKGRSGSHENADGQVFRIVNR